MTPLRLAGLVVFALSACGGRAGAPGDPAGAAARSPVASPAASVERDAASRVEGRDDRARGRPAGIRTLDINGQRTYWVEHCPTDSTSPLREPCSMTRADLGAE